MFTEIDRQREEIHSLNEDNKRLKEEIQATRQGQ
jgi:hypothetical protein